MNYKDVLYPTIAAQLCELFDAPASQEQEIVDRVATLDLFYLTWQIIIDCLPLQLDQLFSLNGKTFAWYHFIDLVAVVFKTKELNKTTICVESCKAYAGSFQHVAIMNEIAPARYGFTTNSILL